MFEQRSVAIVSGSAHGVGYATCRRLGREGYTVLAVDIHDADFDGEPVIECLPCDVRNEEDVRLAVEYARRMGELELVVSSATRMIRKPVFELALDEWNDVLATNLTAAYLWGKHAGPILRETNGSIVLIASTHAMVGEPDAEACAASQGGLVAMGHSLAISLGPEVRVNVVSPGRIETVDSDVELLEGEHHQAGQVGTAADVAEAIVFLASDAASFITGENLVVDGGLSRKMMTYG